MKFAEFAHYLEKLEKTSSRISITEILAELLSKTKSDEIDKVIYLSLGILAPSFQNIVFNLAEKMVIKSIAQAYDVDDAVVNSKYKKMGDLGDVAFDLSSSKKVGGAMSVGDVYENLVKIAEEDGEGSQERKISELAKLLSSVDEQSAKFIVRIPVGKLRLGFSDKTIIDALSWMEVGDKSLAQKIKLAYEVLPDVGKLAIQVKKEGVNFSSEKLKPEVGVPVMPMLAQRIKSTKEMIEKMGTVAVEPKFDGLRVLIHYAKSKNGESPFIRAFTRNLNDVSDMFPELSSIGNYLNVDSVILDSEGVGIDPKTERIVDFQKTMQRRRKHGIMDTAKDIPLRFQVFDVLYAGGNNYMHDTYEERRKVLDKIIKKNKFLVVDSYKLTDDPEFIRNEHRRLVKEGLEGVVVKRLDAKYVPGRTGWRWVKMKESEDSIGKLADTVDCIVMGYTRGKGKRAGFGVGQFLAGIIGEDEKICTVTKVGTGLTDDQFRILNSRLEKITVKEKPKNYLVGKTLEPDFWVEPKLVVELAADEITKSPNHTAGLALRFPRLVKFRDDKNAKQATTLSELEELYGISQEQHEV